jgi:hypothetical protein
MGRLHACAREEGRESRNWPVTDHQSLSPADAAPAQGSGPTTQNGQIAARLSEAADLLAARNANPFRVSAYRKATEALRRLDRDLADIATEGGQEALDAIPDVGPSIAGAISELLRTGRWRFLERLREATGPAELFRVIPGIGPALARRLHETLGAETLEVLETAAYDGRLETVEGVGRRRAAQIRNALAEMLGRVRAHLPARRQEPSVEVLLDVDREYRAKAATDELKRIAPRRFNPTHEAWLPVLQTRRGRWEFTTLYSNTARAHQLGRVRDWVVLYFHEAGKPESQRTIVTERRGSLAGRRVARGREAECRDYYALSTAMMQGRSR